MLTHKNFIAAISTNVESVTMGPEDTVISFLPLAHSKKDHLLKNMDLLIFTNFH